MRIPARHAVVLCAVLALSQLTACGHQSTPSTQGQRVNVVTSTDVYGSIAARIGGSAVEVTALIDSPSQDPHSFEANAHDELAVSKADVLIQNGGGYDDFLSTLRHAAGVEGTELIDVVALSGKRAVDGELNEHVWYDLGTVERLVARLAAVLTAKDPSARATFERNAARFTAQLDDLRRQEARLASIHHGEGVAITEPVALYLLQDCGLVNKTSERFSAAVEEDSGVPVSVLHDTLALFTAHTVRLLVYNAQTSGPETSIVIASAKRAGVPVVAVTETLPAGTDFLGWMTSNVDAVAAALAAPARS